MATNFLKFFSIGSDGVAFMVGASGVNCAAGEGRVCTASGEGIGLLVAWVVGFWGLPLLPFHYLPHSTREGFCLLFSMAHILHIIVGYPAVPKELLLVPLSIPPEATVEPVHLI